MGPLCGDKEPFRVQPGRGAQGQGALLGGKLEAQEPGFMRELWPWQPASFGSLMQEGLGAQTLGSEAEGAGGQQSWQG